MRIVYDDPVPVLIVCTNDTVYYWDKKLDQLSQIGVKDTPAWFLLRPDIRLAGDVTVTGLQRAPGALRIALAETQQSALGRLTLVMSDPPLVFRQCTAFYAHRNPISATHHPHHYA